MSAYSNQVKEYVARWESEVGAKGVIDPQEVAAWAFRHGLMKPNMKTVIDAIAADIAQVFREEYRRHSDGSRYRAMHAVKERMGNKTMSLWADMDNPNAPREHFVRSFADRRKQIVGDCYQLKTDVDVYNDKNKSHPQVQLIIDFTEDVAELQLGDKQEPEAA